MLVTQWYLFVSINHRLPDVIYCDNLQHIFKDLHIILCYLLYITYTFLQYFLLYILLSFNFDSFFYKMSFALWTRHKIVLSFVQSKRLSAFQACYIKLSHWFNPHHKQQTFFSLTNGSTCVKLDICL